MNMKQVVVKETRDILLVGYFTSHEGCPLTLEQSQQVRHLPSNALSSSYVPATVACLGKSPHIRRHSRRGAYSMAFWSLKLDIYQNLMLILVASLLSILPVMRRFLNDAALSVHRHSLPTLELSMPDTGFPGLPCCQCMGTWPGSCQLPHPP